MSLRVGPMASTTSLCTSSGRPAYNAHGVCVSSCMQEAPAAVGLPIGRLAEGRQPCMTMLCLRQPASMLGGCWPDRHQ